MAEKKKKQKQIGELDSYLSLDINEKELQEVYKKIKKAEEINTYFPNAGEQTIILSTDSEIDSTYYDLMKDNVGDEFTLKYDEKTKSTSIERGYLIGA